MPQIKFIFIPLLFHLFIYIYILESRCLVALCLCLTFLRHEANGYHLSNLKELKRNKCNFRRWKQDRLLVESADFIIIIIIIIIIISIFLIINQHNMYRDTDHDDIYNNPLFPYDSLRVFILHL